MQTITRRILVTNALAGIFLFHEWTTTRQLSLGSLALVILVVGAVLTALRLRLQRAKPPKSSLKFVG